MQTTNPTQAAFWAHPSEGEPAGDAGRDALTQAALNSARLAISRWTGGIHAPQMLVVGSLHVSPQARWYAQTRDGFDAWRAQGGFARQDSARNTREDEYFIPSIDIRSSGACVE